MEQAVGDDRAEHSAPDHPLRIVGDHLARIETGIAARQLAVDVARSWVAQGGNGDVAIRVLMHAVRPEMRSTSTDPGLGNTIAIREGAVPLSWIEELSHLWDDILDFVEHNPNLPPAALLDGLAIFVYPGRIGFGQGPDEEAAEAIRKVATRVIDRLSCIYEARPGALRRLRAYAARGELPVQVDVPDGFSRLFPERWDGSDEDGGFGGWERRTSQEVRLLAEDLHERSPDEIAALITVADAEARAAGISYPRLRRIREARR